MSKFFTAVKRGVQAMGEEPAGEPYEGRRHHSSVIGRQSRRNSLAVRPMQVRVLVLAVTLLVGSAGAACSTRRAGNHENAATPPPPSSKRMPDGKWWMTANLDVDTRGSYCYEDAELNCRRYGRLYTWESARRGCQSLGDGWRLPTNDEWRQLAKHYGGVYEDAADRGRAAYEALVIGGSSGLDALLGGGRAHDEGGYARMEAHGFYWTASESDSVSAWFYNLGRGGQSLYRHGDGEKQRAFSVRCVMEEWNRQRFGR